MAAGEPDALVETVAAAVKDVFLVAVVVVCAFVVETIAGLAAFAARSTTLVVVVAVVGARVRIRRWLRGLVPRGA